MSRMLWLLMLVLLPALPAWAQSQSGDVEHYDPGIFDRGKLLATGGVSSLEGTGGGGIATWALITGYETRDGVGMNGHFTYVGLPDFQVRSGGGAVGLMDRVELSYAHLWFDTGATGAKLGLGRGFTFQQDVYGAKLRLFGDAVYDQDSLLPQVAAGAEFKKTDHADILHAVGARDASGADYYLSATKLFLGPSLLVDATLRATRANQLGILGFGGPTDNGYDVKFEGSIAELLRRDLAVGMEYRQKSSRLGFTREDDWKDVFVAFFPAKFVSLTAAYVDLGTIATFKSQHGFYLSLQIGT